MDAEKIGRFICQLRKEKSLTQAALAQQLNLSNRTVSKWENGDGIPDVSVLPQLADALDITVDELLHGEHSSRPVPNVTVTEIADRKNICNIYRILSALSLIIAIFAALLGTLTEVYCIYAFRILFYTHWEVLFSAISLGASLVAVALYTIGVIRLGLVFTPAERRRISFRHTWMLIVILCPFPLSFFLRLLSVFLSVEYLWLEALISAILFAAVLIFLYRRSKQKVKSEGLPHT